MSSSSADTITHLMLNLTQGFVPLNAHKDLSCVAADPPTPSLMSLCTFQRRLNNLAAVTFILTLSASGSTVVMCVWRVQDLLAGLRWLLDAECSVKLLFFWIYFEGCGTFLQSMHGSTSSWLFWKTLLLYFWSDILPL